jgi:hypothetical protein
LIQKGKYLKFDKRSSVTELVLRVLTMQNFLRKGNETRIFLVDVGSVGLLFLKESLLVLKSARKFEA